jgi:hypothetical protein
MPKVKNVIETTHVWLSPADYLCFCALNHVLRHEFSEYVGDTMFDNTEWISVSAHRSGQAYFYVFVITLRRMPMQSDLRRMVVSPTRANERTHSKKKKRGTPGEEREAGFEEAEQDAEWGRGPDRAS